MSEAPSENLNSQQPQEDGEVKTPTKRTPSKRVSRAQRESEELIKNMGGTLDVEGGRKTRSSTRGSAPSTPATPPPAKKPRTTATPRRGRGKKSEAALQATSETDEPTTPTKKTESDNGNEEKVQENCNEENLATSATPNNKDADKAEPEETSEVDSKANPLESTCTDSIAEQSSPTKETESASKKAESSTDDSAAAAEDTKAAETEQSVEDATSVDPVEPMEVDSANPASDPTQSAAEPDETDNIEHNDDAEPAEEVEEVNETEEQPLSSADQESTDVHENSLAADKAVKDANNSSPEVISEGDSVVVEESKTENDICSDPKISTNTNDVVAAQPCN